VQVACSDWVGIGRLMLKGGSAFSPFYFWSMFRFCLGELGLSALLGWVVIGWSWNWGWRVE
jgi:hypothetical protein